MSKAVDRARALLAQVAHLLDEPGEANVVEASRFDGVLFDEAVAASPRLVDAMWDLQRTTSYAQDLYRDLFAAFYQGSPRLRPHEEVKRSRWANEKVLRMNETLESTVELRFFTVHDAIQTANVLVKLAPTIQWWMSQITPDPLLQVFELGWKLEAALDAGAPAAALNAIADALEEAAQEAQESDPEAHGRGQGQGLRTQMSNDLAQAKEQAGELAAGRSAFGMQPGRLEHLSMAEQVHLGEMLSGHELTEWLDLLGLMLNASASPAVVPARERPHGVRLSDDVAEMLASEIALSQHPVLRLDFLSRLADGELLTRDWQGSSAKGPVVILVDESGSMSAPGPKDARGRVVPRKIWAKAFTLAVAQRMRSEGRPLRIISFSSHNQQQVWSDSPADLLAFGSSFQAGMTAFEPALDLAIEQVQEMSNCAHFPSGQKVSAAIVMVTDDDRAKPNKEWLAHWGEVSEGWQKVGVSVGVDTGKALRSICDETTSVSDFLDPSIVSRLVNRIG